MFSWDRWGEDSRIRELVNSADAVDAVFHRLRRQGRLTDRIQEKRVDEFLGIEHLERSTQVWPN